ncbi:kinase-like domain-containing protein [Kockovaella imperatae]|uniref:Kinase-like domain-containing protein n=1 Tax=Kockovaella imperatae TaxID=4999 RepID=A0A1Y1UB64_9TREE|nr:kinase-like domain-containing protein [Kockovaella imperatae]ORX34784.1 kinase-like domain-containing protein [Kockovaella imperatae]
MPSSKSSIDGRDVYYRLGKSAGYRARSAYKLIHLDEEFGIFEGVETAVDLCAAPGSWSQVLTQRLKPGNGRKIVALDLQPMAPLPGVSILQADITQPSTVPRVLEALGSRKADLIVCDGAPDVTGVHDLDAYLHSQLLLAAVTLSLLLLAPHGTLIMKIFLSPHDPKATMLQSQLRGFFPGDFSSPAFEDMTEEEEEGEMEEEKKEASERKTDCPQSGVYIRKPRSSRVGSGEAFIVCRDFDATRLPWSAAPLASVLESLHQDSKGSLSLLTLETLFPDTTSSPEWERLKTYATSGDLDSLPSAPQIQSPIARPIERDALPGRSRESLNARRMWIDTGSRSPSLASVSPSTSTLDVPWDRRPTPLPSPSLGWPGDANRDAPSPAPSTSSKTDIFFGSNEDFLPKPPKPMSVGLDAQMTVTPSKADISIPAPRPGHLGHKKTISVDIVVRAPTVVPARSVSQPQSAGPEGPTDTTTLSHGRSKHGAPRRETREAQDDGLQLASGAELFDDSNSWILITRLGDGAFSSVWSAHPKDLPHSVSAVKLTSRDACDEDARTRVAFLREVSVLRHISHPNIVAYQASFSTATYHCLILEQLPGGELYEVLVDDIRKRQMCRRSPEDPSGEAFARRVFSELVKAVGWLHKVGVVHRDIKLENVLFTVNPFTVCSDDCPIPLDRLPSPLVKLTDFGLARFIDLDHPTLETRCGSESFAAPEIIMGKKYDGRQTDCWALGVLLFALLVGQLPFDSDHEERRKKMMRIAKADFRWPSTVGTQGAREIVQTLLMRDPKKRSSADQLWNHPWMQGPGGISRPTQVTPINGHIKGHRRILDGYLLDEEVSSDATTEMIK